MATYFQTKQIYPSPNCESALISHLLSVIIISLSPVRNSSKSSCVILFWSITEASQGRSGSHKFLLGFCSSLEPGSHARSLHQLLLESVGCALHKGAPDGLHIVSICLPLLRSFNIEDRGSSSLGPGCMHFLWHNFLISHPEVYWYFSPQWLSDKESACSAGAAGDLGLIPGSRRPPGGGYGNPLQHSCLENPMNRGAWQATVQSRKELDTPEVA